MYKSSLNTLKKLGPLRIYCYGCEKVWTAPRKETVRVSSQQQSEPLGQMRVGTLLGHEKTRNDQPTGQPNLFLGLQYFREMVYQMFDYQMILYHHLLFQNWSMQNHQLPVNAPSIYRRDGGYLSIMYLKKVTHQTMPQSVRNKSWIKNELLLKNNLQFNKHHFSGTEFLTPKWILFIMAPSYGWAISSC